MRQYQWIIFIVFSIWMGACFAKAHSTPLPPKEAFILNVTVDQQNLFLNWQMAPGYYLYKNRIKVTAGSSGVVAFDYPQGEFKYSAEYGRQEVYKKNVSFAIPLSLLATPSDLQVSYQGCAEDGFCYPPTTQSYSLNNHRKLTPIGEKPASMDSLLTDQTQISLKLATTNALTTFFLFILLGLLLAFTPCVLPMVPILTSIIVGQRKVTTKKAFLLSLTYVLGMAITYAFAGILAAKAGTSLQIGLQKPWVISVVSILFVLLAFSLFGFYHLRLPHRLHLRLHHLSNRLPGGTYLGVFAMGMLSTLIVSPCITAPLLGVLIFIGDKGDILLGASALFALGLGMGIPLLLIGMSAGRWLPKHGPWMEAVKVAFGFLMLAMGAWLFSRLLTPLHTLMMWGILLIIIAFSIGYYFPKAHKRHYWQRALAVVVAGLGILLLISSEFMPNVVHQWIDLPTQVNTSFITVYNKAQLTKELKTAQINARPVLIDFFASWCESCIQMDKHVFAKEEVRTALAKANFVLLRVDLSANNEDSEALLTAFKVYSPPMILFIDKTGKERQERIAGEMTAREFLMRLEKLNG